MRKNGVKKSKGTNQEDEMVNWVTLWVVAIILLFILAVGVLLVIRFGFWLFS